jgi:hypothetical protein
MLKGETAGAPSEAARRQGRLMARLRAREARDLAGSLRELGQAGALRDLAEKFDGLSESIFELLGWWGGEE